MLEGMGMEPLPSVAGPSGLGCYYNEFDRGASAWLRELMQAGEIPQGVVDDRSIHEVQPGDLPARAHFFAGIGGWEFALRLAGWPDDLPVWTGSCPCQPFSAAGKRKGVADARHLWPEFRRLIAECRPPIIFGEQVASADGRLWLAGVRSDLEALGYAVGASDLCSAGVGAPNIRQRLYWVAVSPSERRDGRQGAARPDRRDGSQDGGAIGGLGGTQSVRLEGWRDRGEGLHKEPFGLLSARSGDDVGAADGWLEHAESVGWQQRRPESSRRSPASGCGLGYWDAFDILPCLDGKARRIEPGSFPLAHGVPGRVGLLRGYGNAINPFVAAEFIAATLEALTARPAPLSPLGEGNLP